MKSIIDELYYGNISSEVIRVPKIKSVDSTAYDEYIKSLSKEQNEAFNKAVDYLLELDSQSNVAIFRYAFKIGVQLGMEIGTEEI